MKPSPSEVPYGTLDLIVLSVLSGMGPLHGYGIARRIEQVAEEPSLSTRGPSTPRS